ncbi:MAG: 2-amino-4-hydroxy-6-hydroxymethyldihydropteridine diphosphokinase [Pseudomonadota bacterium]
MSYSRCAIGLGGNLGDAPETLTQALHALSAMQNSHVIAISALYRSAAIGPAGQPDYANAVITLDTLLSPWQLLDALQALELAAGRVRGLRWGARTLDLDLLLYGDQRIEDARLTVPHPEMHKRAFVLRPLQDIWPDAHWSALPDIVTLLQQPTLAQQALEPWPEPRWLAAQAQYSTPLRSTS